MHLNCPQTLLQCTLAQEKISVFLVPPSLLSSSSMVLLYAKFYFHLHLDAQVAGHPAYITTYPVLDLAVVLSMCAVSALQFPKKSALNLNCMFCSFPITKVTPYSLVASRYLPILNIACLCNSLRSFVNLAH